MWDSFRPFPGPRDPVSAGTHFFALLGAVYATAILWRICRGDRRKQWSLACFGVSMIALYLASATYHSVRGSPERLQFYRLLDHSAIYGLIAGTYTPLFAVLLRPGRKRRLALALIWGFAAVGIAAKWLFPDVPYWLTISLYLGMGWAGVLALPRLVRAVGLWPMLFGLLGGLFYTLGGLADFFGWPVLRPGLIGPHEVFHVCDMLGTSCHVLFMLRYVVPFRGYPVLPPLPEPAPSPAVFAPEQSVV